MRLVPDRLLPQRAAGPPPLLDRRSALRREVFLIQNLVMVSKDVVARKKTSQRIHSGTMTGREVVVGVSGASGGWLARRFVELALQARELARLHLVVSGSALAVARQEIDEAIA